VIRSPLASSADDPFIAWCTTALFWFGRFCIAVELVLAVLCLADDWWWRGCAEACATAAGSWLLLWGLRWLLARGGEAR